MTVARAKDQAATIRGYRRMEKILADFSSAQVLPFDESAGGQFDDFRRQHIRVGTGLLLEAGSRRRGTGPGRVRFQPRVHALHSFASGIGSHFA